MTEKGPNKTYIDPKPLERRIRNPYDAKEDLRKVEDNLNWRSILAKPIFLFNAGTPEAVARVDAWHDARLAEIKRAEQQYRQRLVDARESGAIDANECNRALMDLIGPTSLFERLRSEAYNIYRKEVKFS